MGRGKGGHRLAGRDDRGGKGPRAERMRQAVLFMWPGGRDVEKVEGTKRRITENGDLERL